jgi:hypothetical protein
MGDGAHRAKGLVGEDGHGEVLVDFCWRCERLPDGAVRSEEEVM